MHLQHWIASLALTASLSATGAWGIMTVDIPSAAPDDAVMAKPDEIASMARWAAVAFGSEQDATPDSPIPIRVRRQDFNVLRFGQSLHGNAD